MVLDNRHSLFEGGDERVGTLLLWHFVEEIEHRSSALIVQHHVTPDPWYRLRTAPQVFRHVTGVFQGIADGIDEHVGAEACGIPPERIGPMGMRDAEIRDRMPWAHWEGPPSMLHRVPGRDLRTMIWHLARSQAPRHDPAHEPLPMWVDQWHAVYDAQDDITTYAGARL